VFVGEGAGPTWETGSYKATWLDNDNGTTSTGNTGGGGENTFDLLSNATDFLQAANYPESIRLWLDNVSSTSLYKVATFIVSEAKSPTSGYPAQFTGTSFWSADTNAITGLRVEVDRYPAVGTPTFSGTCTLYGMN
jgi:hypothetical protein